MDFNIMRKLQDLFFSGRSGVDKRLAEEIELLHKSPLLDPVWYRQNYSDLRDTPIDVARHYLEHGAAEGRNPHPMFDTKYYLEQNPDVAKAGMNPLVHYIRFGASERRAAYPPKNDNVQISPDVHGHSPHQRNPAPIAPSASNAEPGIKPPPLVAGSKLDPAELYRRNAQVVSAVRLLRSRTDGVTANGTPRSDETDLSYVKLGLVGADDRLSPELASSCLRESLARSKSPDAYLEALLGLGITPDKTITEDNLPDYATPILQRYNAGRLEATRRFRLDPSRASTISGGTTISILMPTYKTPLIYLERSILSVLFQTYANWELLIVDDGTNQTDLATLIKYYASADHRIKVTLFAHNAGISAATNAALKMASGPYIGLLDHDDMLTRDALEKVADRLSEDPALDFVYSDECTIDADDIVDALFHKPDWSPLLLLNMMYTGHFSVYRRSLVETVGRFRSEFDLSQDYDLALRIAEYKPKVSHIEECLYGWRMIPGSSSIGGKSDARISNIAALQSASDRRGYDGTAIPLPTANRVKRRPPAKRPLVSIVVPSAGKFSRLKETVDSIRSLTTYDNYEILFVTSSSVIETLGSQFISHDTFFVSYDKPFNFSDKCNVGAARARGEYLIFYNDDVLVISPDWIETILEYVTLPGVGAVGAKLIYPNGTIQHAGMVTGVRRLVGTAFHSFLAQTTAYFNLAQSVREVSIICGACLAMPTSIFKEIGGWDTENTPSAHSDIDLCFRVWERGYCCIYTPHAELIHIGHVEIGADEAAVKKQKAFKKDKADIFLMKRWGEFIGRDPYFPPKMRDLVFVDSQETFRYFPSFRASNVRGPNVVIFSNDLSGSGAPKVVFDMAVNLLEQGCFVLVVSPLDGVYRSKLLEIGAHVIVDPVALTGHETIADLGKNFDIIICNTVVTWRAVSQLTPFSSVYWYIHETELVGHLMEQHPDLLEIFASATAIWTGSSFSRDFLRRYNIDAAVLEYGVEDPFETSLIRERPPTPNEITISVLGTYESRKGQDLAILGYLAIPLDRRRRCRLRLAGRTNDHFFRDAIENIVIEHGAQTYIEFNGELDYESYLKLLSDTDILLCPSRDDTLPLVSLNALAEGKILICSQETGTSKYIQDGVSGFVLEHNGPDEIAATLIRAVDGFSDWPNFRREARRVFTENFSRERFRSRFLESLGLAHWDAAHDGPAHGKAS